ncbi:unnamed protein product [Caenorhabditis auriculariae]|uniref:C2H2-type domain-containing protein n=1 Tax=Caenorhabditis auriculariae TaxID=2777116 RepID=A0A8S1HJ78_9PELO|nr:unnamed protein product [Caenorhabditis auriculariae]
MRRETRRTQRNVWRRRRACVAATAAAARYTDRHLSKENTNHPCKKGSMGGVWPEKEGRPWETARPATAASRVPPDPTCFGASGASPDDVDDVDVCQNPEGEDVRRQRALTGDSKEREYIVSIRTYSGSEGAEWLSSSPSSILDVPSRGPNSHKCSFRRDVSVVREWRLPPAATQHTPPTRLEKNRHRREHYAQNGQSIRARWRVPALTLIGRRRNASGAVVVVTVANTHTPPFSAHFATFFFFMPFLILTKKLALNSDLQGLRPRFAVVALTGNCNFIQLFKDLLQKGFPVTFLNDLNDHPEVRRATTTVDAKNGPDPPVQGSESSQEASPPRSGRSDSPSVAGKFDQTMERVIATSSLFANSGDPNHLVSNLFRTEAQQERKIQTKNLKRNCNLDHGDCIVCKLCDSKIMVSRYSNLTNHVRRHASVKQYQCQYCVYQNNEQAKVRLHMSNQHEDTVLQPIDKLNPKMQEIWNNLMEQCFPGYGGLMANREFGKRRRSASPVGEPFPCIPSASAAPAPDPATTTVHLRRRGLGSLSYQCCYCDFQSNDQVKVHKHMTSAHEEKTKEAGKGRWDALLEQCFPPNNAAAKADPTANDKAAASPSVSENSNSSLGAPESEEVIPKPLKIHKCMECEMVVPVPEGPPATVVEPLASHLQVYHHEDCLPFTCDECGYKNAEQWKVRWHISVRHSTSAAEITVSKSPTAIFHLFIKKYFPKAFEIELDEEEEELLRKSTDFKKEEEPKKAEEPPKKRKNRRKNLC